MRPPVHVDCLPTEGGWSCTSRVGTDPAATTHQVLVSTDDVTRLAHGRTTPQRLVEESFAFLLEREPRESILREFDLPMIGRYFPEYEGEIRRRLAG